MRAQTSQHMLISRSLRVVGGGICRAACGGPPSRPFRKWRMSGPGRVSFFGSCYTLMQLPLPFTPISSRWRGEGARPSGAPRIPARAPRATRAHIWRAFPPETSGPATRPRRGLAPRRPGGRDLINSSHVTRSPHPANPAALYDPFARSKLSRRVCILRGSRTAGGPSRFETQGCAADGTADSPHLWRAATYNIMCE